MAHTFEIRFARNAGLTGLLEAPANSFRWKGDGRISIDAQGISIAVRRGLLTLFAPRTRRIPAEQLTEVYREGEALRLTFITPDASRTTLPIWAKDRHAAAEIVKLLPTAHTVELEDSPPAGRGYRLDRPLLWTTVVVVALGIGALVLRQALTGATGPYPDAARDSAAPRPIEALPEPTGAMSAAAIPQSSSSAASESTALPEAGTASTSDDAPLLYSALLADIDALHTACLTFGNGPKCDDSQWWAITVRLYEFDSTDHLREHHAAVSRCWRGYLAGGAAAGFDRQLAQTLMERAREWRR
jgi:hypothetical protein